MRFTIKKYYVLKNIHYQQDFNIKYIFNNGDFIMFYQLL